jgi:hypothetical protein
MLLLISRYTEGTIIKLDKSNDSCISQITLTGDDCLNSDGYYITIKNDTHFTIGSNCVDVIMEIPLMSCIDMSELIDIEYHWVVENASCKDSLNEDSPSFTTCVIDFYDIKYDPSITNYVCTDNRVIKEIGMGTCIDEMVILNDSHYSMKNVIKSYTKDHCVVDNGLSFSIRGCYSQKKELPKEKKRCVSMITNDIDCIMTSLNWAEYLEMKLSYDDHEILLNVTESHILIMNQSLIPSNKINVGDSMTLGKNTIYKVMDIQLREGFVWNYVCLKPYFTVDNLDAKIPFITIENNDWIINVFKWLLI